MNYVHAASEATCVAQGFLDKINDAVFYPLIALLTGVALLVFLWGAFQFIFRADSPGAREAGRDHMIYGVIGLFVMVSALTILTIAANTFNLGIPDDSGCSGATAPGQFGDGSRGN